MPETKRNNPKIDNTYAHVQPQAVDVERVVLGALMIDKDAFAMISEHIKAETFYEPRHQKIFAAIQSLNLHDKPVDVLTVIDQLKHDGTLEEIGGEPYVLELSSSVASSAHIEYHSKILAQKHLARQLISYAGMLETQAFDESVDVDELMQKAEGALFEISQKNIQSDYTQINPVVKQAMINLQKSAERDGGLTGIPTGYAALDEVTSGLQNSDLMIIAGRPAMGKTSFALSMAKNIAIDHKIPTGFFTLEMSDTQLVNRLISNTCEIAGSKILTGQLNSDEWERLDRNLAQLDNVPLYIDQTPSLSIFELRTKARRMVRSEGVKVIMIDYLQLMTASGMRFNSRQEEVSIISRSLKGLVKDLNIPIVALSQLNRAVDNRGDGMDKRPQLSDLRESGSIEQDADIVLFVHRPEYYKIYQDTNGNDLRGKAQIIIAKHRKGATKDVLLGFRGEYTRFENLRNDAPLMSDPRDGGEILSSRSVTGADQAPPPDMPFAAGHPDAEF